MENNYPLNEISNYIEIYFTSSSFKDQSDFISSLVIFENEFVEKIKIKYELLSERKIVKQKFYEKLELYVLKNQNFKEHYGGYLKKLHKNFSDQLKLHKINGDNKTIWKKLKTFLDKNGEYTKFSIASLKLFMKINYKQDVLKEKTFFDNNTLILNKIYIKKEISFEDFGIQQESIENIMELIKLSNLEWIKNNLEEFTNSKVFKYFAILTNHNFDDLEMPPFDRLNKIKTYLNTSGLFKNGITILFLTLLFYDFIEITPYGTISENFSSNDFCFSSINRIILLNVIKTFDEIIYNQDIKHLFTIILQIISNNPNFKNKFLKKAPNLIIENSKMKNQNFYFSEIYQLNYNTFNFDKIKDIIQSSCTNEIIQKSLNDLLKDIKIQENNNTTPITNAASKFMGFLSNVVSDKYKKTTNEIQSLLNKPLLSDDLNIQSLKLYPYSHGTVYPHVYICISGFTSELDEDIIEWEKFAECLNEDSNFYFYKWESENKYNMAIDISKTCFDFYKILKNNDNYEKSKNFMNKLDEYRKNNLFLKAKKNSKFYGKILAHIIASRSIFPFQTISLVAFSLGCNVIKSCLKELYKMSLQCEELKLNDIIQNVILIGGATTFVNISNWIIYFKFLVKGHIINCYSQADNILKYLYTVTTAKEPIGNSELIFSTYLSNFRNLDFTFMTMGHGEYRDYLYILVRKIKIIINI